MINKTLSQQSLAPAGGTNDSGVKTIVVDGRRLVVVGDDGDSHDSLARKTDSQESLQRQMWRSQH